VTFPPPVPGELARLEARLAELDAERTALQSRIAELRRTAPTLSTISVTPSRSSPTPPPTTAEAKVALFASLFRGRADVYPRLWTNQKKGTKGYSPACLNEWNRPLCQKPRVRCGECPHQSWDPLSPGVIRNHLQGEHVIGVYPLLRDERCHLLAIDFDKGSWTDEVLAFAETCRSVGLPATVERSRSGNGAHVWFFFEEPVLAAVARKVGCYLLTETMARRPGLGMESYDRLFPNQDTMPRGGFGNLIALPLQFEPRKIGNTVFLDDSLRPHPDQWAFLAGVPRIPAMSADLVAREAQRQGRVLGVRFPMVEEEVAPWARPPSGRTPRTTPQEAAPASVHCVRGNRFYVDRVGLPAALVTDLRRLAAFQNPDFYKKQAMRLSTKGTPRVVTCALEEGSFLSLPRGCDRDAIELLGEWGSKAALSDERVGGRNSPFRFQGELLDVQRRAAAGVLPHDIGVVVAPPGTGKTYSPPTSSRSERPRPWCSSTASRSSISG
jgi:hypothetical protein